MTGGFGRPHDETSLVRDCQWKPGGDNGEGGNDSNTPADEHEDEHEDEDENEDEEIRELREMMLWATMSKRLSVRGVAPAGGSGRHWQPTQRFGTAPSRGPTKEPDCTASGISSNGGADSRVG